MTKLSELPDGLEAIIDEYGNPDADGDGRADRSFIDAKLIRVELPFPLRNSWGEMASVRTTWVHRGIWPALEDALRELERRVPWAILFGASLDIWGGLYNHRRMTGYDALSAHAWGIAVDLAPHIGRYGADPRCYPSVIVDVMKSRGFAWGGDWKAPWTPDPMHFQACRGY